MNNLTARGIQQAKSKKKTYRMYDGLELSLYG